MHVAPNGLVVVRFNESYRQYTPGTVAGFPEKTARSMVETGMAEFYHPDKPAPKPAPVKEEKSKVVVKEESPKREVSDEPDPLLLVRDDPDWRSMNGNKLRSLASKISEAPINNKDDAIAAIELALDADNAG